MSYIDLITEPLIQLLNHNADLPLHKFVGHVANAEFWMQEVRHRLHVIDGYHGRFAHLRDAQVEFDRLHGRHLTDTTDESGGVISGPPMRPPVNPAVSSPIRPPLRPNTADEDLKAIRRRLLDAAHRFLDRAEQESALGARQVDELRGVAMGR